MNRTRVRYFCARHLAGAALVTACAAGWAASPSASIQDPAPNPNVERLLTTRECRGCDFTNTEIVNKDLRGVDLANASFEGGSLYASDLTGANLTGVNFRDAVLKRADLKDAALAGANFDAADLSMAMNADLRAAGTTPSTTCPDLSKGPCQ